MEQAGLPLPESDQRPPKALEARPGRFLTHVLQMMSGTTFSQLLTIVTAPLLTHLYSPEVFGASSVFVSITTFIGVLACLRYELAIVLPEDDGEAGNLLAVSLFSALLFSLAALPVFCFGRGPLLRFLHAEGLAPYMPLVAPQVFCTAILLAMSYWYSRQRRFKALASVMVVQTGATNGLQLGLGYAGMPTVGARIGSTLAGAALSVAALLGGSWRRDRRSLSGQVTASRMRQAMVRYRKFPLISIWSALLNNLSWQLPVFLLSKYFSAAVVGFFSVANRMVLLPMGLLGNAVSNVFYQRATVARQQGNLAVVVENSFRWLIELGLFPFLLLTIVGREVFVFTFGRHWAEAGTYAQIMALWALIMFISSPLSTLFNVLERQELALKTHVIIFTSRFGAFFIGGVSGRPRLALVLYSVLGVIAYGYLSLKLVAISGVSLPRLAGPVRRGLFFSVPAASALLGLKALSVPPWIVVVASGLMLAAYFILLARRESEVFRMLLQELSPRR